MPSMTRNVKPGTPLHKKLTTRLQSRLKMAEKQQARQHEKWRRAEESMMAYIPTSEEDRIRKLRRDGGQPTYTNIVVPYTYGMVMTAHTYLTSVFLGRTPIHQFAGRHGETEQQTQALEALIGYQTEMGGLAAAYHIWLHDVLKYGLGIMGEYWEDLTIQYGMVEEIDDPLRPGKKIKTQSTREVEGYSGNRVHNIAPFDFLHDPRVSVMNFQKGEFCAVRRLIMWNELVRRARQGYYTEEALQALRSPGKWGGNGEEEQQHSALARPEESSLLDVDEQGREFRHPSFARIYEVYVDLIPKEWGLGKEEYPQKWVFTITSDYLTILGAQPLGAIHGEFPFTVGECEIEAYGEYNRGMPEVVEGMQQTMDWLVNSHFWNVRQTMNNQFVIDPSKITMRDVEKGGAGWVWRLRPEAYGTNPKDAIYQVETRDVTASHIGDVQNIFGIGERTLGINEQMMGAGPPGGRVTATSTRTSAGFGISRLKTIAEYISVSCFSGHASRLVQNSQQFYDGAKKLRIVGDLMLTAGMNFIQVTPDMISGAYSFVPVDGTLPVDRFAQATLWKDIFTQIVTIPGMGQTYDLGKLFAYIAQLAGLKNINQFKMQPMGQPQIDAQVQQGNLRPIPGSGAANSMAGGPTSLPTPGSPQMAAA